MGLSLWAQQAAQVRSSPWRARAPPARRARSSGCVDLDFLRDPRSRVVAAVLPSGGVQAGHASSSAPSSSLQAPSRASHISPCLPP